MSERDSQRSNRPGAAQLTGMALAVWLAGAGCADAPEPQAPASHARRAPDTQRVAALEAEIAGLRADLEQAERSLRDAASGLEQQLTMADAVSALINDSKRRARMGQNARKFAREHFTSWNDRIAMEMKLIESLIEQAKQPT